MSAANPLESIRRGVTEIISDAEFSAKLSAKRPLIIKAGFDPTAPDLHLGHTVLLRKLRHFQDLNHKVIFLIGDATGLVGDPSGQSQTRKVLTWEEVGANAKTYLQQVSKILLTDRERFEVRYNSEWFLGRSPQRRSQGLESFDFAKFVTLASRTTLARLIERDDFSKRLKAGKPVSFLELFYPLMQGYDSVKIAEQHGHCDVELGGTDQKLNLLMGRELLKEYGKAPQVVITMPLLEGTDGVHKMSKSLGNQIGIAEPPGEMFGKLMSIPDVLITKYLTLLTDADSAQILEVGQQLTTRSINPRDAKAELATTLVSQYHGAPAAQEAAKEFTKVFSRREQPSDIPELALQDSDPVDLIDLLVASKLAATKNEARRLVKQGGVKLNGKTVKASSVSRAEASGAVLQVGPRRFRKLIA
ncbi:MAG: tyrosine--tRNA ligase [Candidatus Omnitrophota bacterium]|nr:tyrosine--tRNA ligase [Candidatus Omnitrophota bacterium]